MLKRLGLAILLLLLCLAAFAGTWLWMRLRQLESQRAVTPAPTVVPTVRPSPSAAPAVNPTPAATPPEGYRLAGVALGEPSSFAVVEDPLGRSGLYRVGDPIDGLGRLRTIEAERVVVDGPDGVVELVLAPAPVPTAPRVETRAPGTPGASVTPKRRRGPTADSIPESDSSTGPDRPAS